MTDRADFEATHVYSSAPQAAAKREIDRQIMSGDYSAGRWVRLDNESYLRDLVRYRARAGAALGHDLQEMIASAIGTAIGNVDRRMKAAVGPVQRRPVLKIIDAAEDHLGGGGADQRQKRSRC